VFENLPVVVGNIIGYIRDSETAKKYLEDLEEAADIMRKRHLELVKSEEK
jgi:hypothetical protein